MAELKTKATTASVPAFLDAISDPQMREDCRAIAGILRDATKAEPKMWGPAIVGFGDYRYVYPNGRVLDWMVIGFAPRKKNIVVYLADGFAPHAELLSQLGKHSCGKGCLYIQRLG